MGKFEDVWTLLLPEAEALRAQGTKPQDICMRLAVLGFGDKTKYNTVKGWYKRQFKDWPEDGEDVYYMGSRQRHSDIHPQIEAYHLLPVPLQYSDESQIQPHEGQDYSPRQELDFLQQQSSNALQRQGNGSVLQWTQHTATHNMPDEQYLHNFHPKPRRPSGSSSRQTFQQSEAEGSIARHLSIQGLLSQQHPYGIARGPDQQSSVDTVRSSNPHVDVQPNEATIPQQMLIVGDEGQYARRNSSQHIDISFANVEYNYLQSGPVSIDARSLATIQPGDFSDFLCTNFPGIGGGDDIHDQISGSGILPSQSTNYLSEPLLPSNSYSITPSILTNETRTPQLAPEPLDTSHRLGNPVTPYNIEHNTINQPKSVRRSTKHHRVSSTFPDATLPPQCSLPPDPPRVVRRRADQTVPTPWEPVMVEGSKVVPVDPEEYHPRKLVKRQLGSEARDSIGIYHDQSEGSSTVRQSSTTRSTMSDTSRQPLSDQPVNPSNTSTCSSIRDLGYISSVESKLRNSFTSLKLTDDPTFKMNHTESDDGYVVLKFKTKWRVRRSYIERLDECPAPF